MPLIFVMALQVSSCGAPSLFSLIICLLPNGPANGFARRTLPARRKRIKGREGLGVDAYFQNFIGVNRGRASGTWPDPAMSRFFHRGVSFHFDYLQFLKIGCEK